MAEYDVKGKVALVTGAGSGKHVNVVSSRHAILIMFPCQASATPSLSTFSGRAAPS